MPKIKKISRFCSGFNLIMFVEEDYKNKTFKKRFGLNGDLRSIKFVDN
jgi:hypothetical protein